MSHRTTFASHVTRTVRSWPPGTQSIAGAAAAAGDPASLLGLGAALRRHGGQPRAK